MSVVQLTLLGGQPAFRDPLHVGRPNLGDRGRLLARMNDLLDRRWLSNHGIYVQQFERELASRTGARHCITVCNATVGLEVAIRALDLQGEVIVPAFTFVATAHALQWLGLTPVFCDVDHRTHMLDPVRVEALITPHTSAILPVHLWGRVCATEALENIARRHGLKLLFDAAHAFGCARGGRSVGTFGNAEVFSFHATKFLNSFEGGAIATNDDALARRIRLMTNFGFAGYDEVVELGTNGKMTEPAAAMGLTSLESIEEFISVNRRNQKQYAQELAGIVGVRLLPVGAEEQSNHQYVVLEIEEAVAGLSRDLLHRVLQAENVFARRYFHPGCHRMEPYRTLSPDVAASLPNTEQLCSRVLVLPTGIAVGPAEIATIGQLIRQATAQANLIREHVRREV